MNIKRVHSAKCHCGAVELELTMPNGLEDPRRCSCSMCRKRGAIAASVLLENLKNGCRMLDVEVRMIYLKHSFPHRLIYINSNICNLT